MTICPVSFAKPVDSPGEYNKYASSDSIVLGLAVEAAVGRSLSQYLEEKIWVPAGMEYPAYWNTGYHGNTLGHAFLSAALGDFLRFGSLYLNEGQQNGQQIIPADWITESVYRPEPEFERSGPTG